MKEQDLEVTIDEKNYNDRLKSLARHLKQFPFADKKSLKDYWTASDPRLQEQIKAKTEPNVYHPNIPIKTPLLKFNTPVV